MSNWIKVSDRLPKVTKKGSWSFSNRCVVVVNKDGEKYAAFAELSSYLDLPNEWRIEGHNGDWHSRVSHWMPLPELPKA